MPGSKDCPQPLTMPCYSSYFRKLRCVNLRLGWAAAWCKKVIWGQETNFITVPPFGFRLLTLYSLSKDSFLQTVEEVSFYFLTFKTLHFLTRNPLFRTPKSVNTFSYSHDTCISLNQNLKSYPVYRSSDRLIYYGGIEWKSGSK